MKPQCSLVHSQTPTLSHSNQLIPPPTDLLKIHFNIIIPSTPRSSKWSLSLRSPSPKPCKHLSYMPYVPHVQLSSLLLISSPEYWVMGTDHEAPRYVVFFIPLVQKLEILAVVSGCQSDMMSRTLPKMGTCTGRHYSDVFWPVKLTFWRRTFFSNFSTPCI